VSNVRVSYGLVRVSRVVTVSRVSVTVIVLGLVVRFNAGIATYVLRNDKKIKNMINYR